MPARKNDPIQRALAVRMYQGGLGYHAIGQMLGLSHTTVRWYVGEAGQCRTKAEQEEVTCERIAAAQRKRRVREDWQAAPDTKPDDPAHDLPTCWVCHGRSQTWDGHDQCRGRNPRRAA